MDNIVSNRSSPLLFSDSQPDMLLPYQVQHDLISFGPADEEGKSVPRRRLTSDNYSGPSIQIPEVTQDRPNHGTQTSPVFEANPVEHIQDVYGSCDEDPSQHKVKIEVPSSENREKVIPKSESYIRPGYSQYLESRRHSIDLNDNVDETSVWRPDISNRGNRGNVDIGSRGNRENVIFGEGVGLARSRYSRHMPTVEEIAREIQDRGYTVGSGTFIPCRENSAFRPCRSEIGYSTRLRRQNMDCHSGYEGENPLRDPYMLPEGPGLGNRNGTFVAREQGPGFHKMRDTRRMGQETFTQPVSVNSEYNMDSRDSTRLFNNPPVVQTNPCRNDRETNFHEKQPYRKQKEPDKYDGEKVEWQDFQVHFETVATWNGWTETEKGLQLATCLRGKAQKVLSELKPSQKSDYYTLTSVLAKRFSPPHRENAFRAVFRQRKRQPKESLMDYGCEVSRLAQKAYLEFPYKALDQVSREQFVRGLSDVDMKRHVDLQNPSSLEEAISLATQFESFDLGEDHDSTAGRGETRPARGRSAHVQAEEQPVKKKDRCTNEELASLRKRIEVLIVRESIAEKALKTVAELEQKVSKLTEQVESLTKIGLAKTKSYQSNWKNRPDRFRNQNNGNSRPTGNCFGCGQPGHYRNACPKIKKTQFKSVSERQETSQSKARTVTKKGLWFVPGTIEGVKVEMLVDSGSDVALVDSKFYNSIPAAARPSLGPSTWSVDITSGSPIVAIGEANFQLQLGNQTCSYPFVVADLGLRRISVVIGRDFLEDNKCLVDMGHGFLRIKDEKILMRREFSADDRIVEQKEQVSSDEPKIAAEIPESLEVASPSESSPLSETSTKTRTSRKKRKRKRRSQAQYRIWNVKWNERQKFHGPWQYGPYEWRCEVKACHQMEAFPTFSSLEKHFSKVHHSRRIEYVCAFKGPMCCRNPKHDLVRNHCRNAGQHRRIPKPVKMAQTEHMPWIWAVNPDYIEVCNIPPLPKDPVGGQVLNPTPKPLAFTVFVPQPLERIHELSRHPSEMVQMYQREENSELMKVCQKIDAVKALLCKRHELDCLEETTGAEKPDGLLESPEAGASGLLTQSEIEVKPDIPVDVGYGEDSDN